MNITINAQFIQDPTISLEAKGMLLWLLTNPVDPINKTTVSEFYKSAPVGCVKYGRHAVTRIFDELIANGYIKCTRIHGGGFAYQIFETPTFE